MGEQEFNSVVKPISQRLYMLCCRILRNSDEARDALQEVLIKLWIGRNQISELKNIDAYATTVARNHCFDRLRTRKEHLGEEHILNNHQETNDDDETKSKLDAIKIALKRLNEHQQQVFTMRDIEGMEFEEIALQLSMSPENVRVTLSRARKSIREIIQKLKVSNTISKNGS
jgi:RNA polymerase sigma-70 factor (ECF subfamily)